MAIEIDRGKEKFSLRTIKMSWRARLSTNMLQLRFAFDPHSQASEGTRFVVATPSYNFRCGCVPHDELQPDHVL